MTGLRNLSVKHSYQNALVIGGTGVGKSSTVLIPSLLSMTGNFVVHDPSGELYEKSAGYLHCNGYTVKRLHFGNPDVSIGFNPLARTNTSSEVNKVASLLIRSVLGRSSQPFWNYQAQSLVATVIRIVKTQAPEYQTLATVRGFLQLMMVDPQKVGWLVMKHADSTVHRAYGAFEQYEEKLRTSIIATCLAALTLFSDEIIMSITSVDTFDMSVLRTEKTALFIQTPLTDQYYYSTLTSIFFDQLLGTLMHQRPEKHDHDVFFLIDESTSLYLPTLHIAIANVRKYRAGMLLVLQDFNQLIHLYGVAHAETIRSNCFAKLYFTGQSLHTAKTLEMMLGVYEYTDDNGINRVRPLMTADEIQTLDPTYALLFCGHHRPMKIQLRPYYKDRWLRAYSNLGTPYQQRVIPLSISQHPLIR